MVATVENLDKQYFLTIKELYVVFMNTPENGTTDPVYDETIFKQANITELGLKPDVKSLVKYASGQQIINAYKVTTWELAFKLAYLHSKVRDKMFNKKIKNGVSYGTADVVEPTYFAIGIRAPRNDGTEVAMWYPKCSIAPAEETYQTSNDDMKLDDVSYTITANPLNTNNRTYFDFDSAREEATGVTVDKFMEKVIVSDAMITDLKTD